MYQRKVVNLKQEQAINLDCCINHRWPVPLDKLLRRWKTKRLALSDPYISIYLGTSKSKRQRRKYNITAPEKFENVENQQMTIFSNNIIFNKGRLIIFIVGYISLLQFTPITSVKQRYVTKIEVMY